MRAIPQTNLIAFSLVFFGVVSLASGRLQDSLPSARQAQRGVSEIVKVSIDAVVLVVASGEGSRETVQGSGFIVSPDGRIVTNYHVIEGVRSAIVKLNNGAFYPVEGLLGADREKDLAILKVTARDLPILSLGDSDALSIGEGVIAIGSPLGLENTVSDGIVSSVREESEGRKWIQTTAPASPGNSGGPLLDLQGRAVGVITWGVKQGQNLNFAIPINAVKVLLDSSHTLVSLGTGGQRYGRVTGRIWTSMASGLDRMVRIDGEYIYTDWVILSPSAREAGVFQRCELKKSGEIWAGKCRAPVQCQLGFWDNYQYRWCLQEWTMEIRSMTDSRIEGRAESPVDYDCKKCIARKTQWISFSWIPKE